MFIDAKKNSVVTTLTNYGTAEKPMFEVETYTYEQSDISMPDYMCFTEQLRELKFWINGDVKPKKSGTYVCWTESDKIRTLDYSKKHEAFNILDKDADRRMQIHIKKWMHMESFLLLTMEGDEFARILSTLPDTQARRRKEEEEFKWLQGQA